MSHRPRDCSSSDEAVGEGVTFTQIQWRSDRGTLKCAKAWPPLVSLEEGTLGRQLCTPQRKHSHTVVGTFGSITTDDEAFDAPGFP